MTYIKINGEIYQAGISGSLRDYSWGERASKSITLTMSYADAAALFVDNIAWSIVMDVETESGETVQEEYDNSEYCIAGDITDHRDGTVTAKMGKLTELEKAGTAADYERAYSEGVQSA